MTALEIDIVSIRQLPPFAQLDEATLIELTPGGHLLSLPRGERVLSRGDRIAGLHVVCDGQLKIYMLSSDGNERVLQVLQAGQRFGDPMLFDESPSPVFVETLSRCQLAHLPRSAVIAAMQADARFTTFMLSGLSELIRGLMQDIEACCPMSARQRVGAFLPREAEANGTSITEVYLPAEKWILASMLNLSAETFSRELHGMEAQGLIEISGRHVLLRDRAGLLRLVGGDRSNACRSEPRRTAVARSPSDGWWTQFANLPHRHRSYLCRRFGVADRKGPHRLPVA